MNFYLDQEFIERPGFLELISIGIACENGNTYYAISKEFNFHDCSEWVQENVLEALVEDAIKRYYKTPEEMEQLQLRMKNLRLIGRVKLIQEEQGKTKAIIAAEIVGFVAKQKGYKPVLDYNTKQYHFAHSVSNEEIVGADIKFYGYYADYDWVLFCWLYGTMMQLPKGFPMFCIDLKQIMDAVKLPEVNIPVQKNEHHAESDALWNLALHKSCFQFINEANRRKELPDADVHFRIFIIDGKQVLAYKHGTMDEGNIKRFEIRLKFVYDHKIVCDAAMVEYLHLEARRDRAFANLDIEEVREVVNQLTAGAKEHLEYELDPEDEYEDSDDEHIHALMNM